jgi:hypothetical protein
MQIEIRLKKVLKEHGLDRHGVTQRIADDLEIDRHTVRKFYFNRNRNPSLKVLGRICDWLLEHRVPARSLPMALFGAQASALWPAAAAAGAVTIYLGEYQQAMAQAHMPWISRRDAAVEAALVRWLSTAGVCGDTQPALGTEYVPFRVDVSAEHIRKKELDKDHAKALQMYAKIRGELSRSCAILVGSQRVNLLVEAFFADLFGCEPFVAESRDVRVPVFLAYKSPLGAIESCFGGPKNPAGARKRFVKGTHYLNAAGEWVCVPSIDGKQDSGIIITSYEPDIKGLTLAVFGLSGRASEALGHYLIQNAAPFWPPYAEKRGRKVGVYVCKITYPPKTAGDQGEPGNAKDVQVVPLDAAILTQYLKSR